MLFPVHEEAELRLPFGFWLPPSFQHTFIDIEKSSMQVRRLQT